MGVLKVGWGRASGNHQGEANSVNQADGVSYMAPPVSAVALLGEGSEKEQWPLPAHLSGRKLPSALALMLDNSVSSLMSLVPFNLLLPC